jgi:4-hydroxyphenylpyruvate dioxygenase
MEQHAEDGDTIRFFDITTAFGDTIFRFLQCSGPIPHLPGLARTGATKNQGNRFGIQGVDHITSNFLTLKPATMWMEEVLGLEPYWDIAFHTRDLMGERDGGSGLRSVVMWDPASGIKFANNEPAAPYFNSSQIYQFCTDHRGAGVQHVALSVGDIVATVRGMRGRGVQFMPTPAAYYDMLPARLVELGVDAIDEDIATLRQLEILVDGDGPRRYLLQVFMREAAGLFRDPQAGPLFIELIQRKGNDGFGAGNFRALFESIERQQRTD